MSFRSIGALPTCLHGRLAPSRTLRSCVPPPLQRCPYSLAQAAEIDPRNVITNNRLAEAASTRSDDTKYASRKPNRSNHAVRSFKNSPQNATNPITPSNNIETSLSSRPIFRPSETLNSLHSTDDSYSNKVAPNGHLELENKQSLLENKIGEPPTQRYTEWEVLHDKFCEIRTSAPDRLQEVFSEQKGLAQRLVGDIIHEELSPLEFNCKWSAIGWKEREKLIPSLLIGSLVTSAAQTLFVLSNVQYIPYDFLVRMNCLRHLRRMYGKEIRKSLKLKLIYEEIIEELRSPESWPQHRLSPVLLHNLLIWSTAEQCQKIVRDFSEKYAIDDLASEITIIDHFLRIEDREQAFDHFKRLPQDVLLQPSESIINFRNRLLKLDFVESSETGTNFKYLPQVLALGMSPDEDLYTIVIENAITNGLPDVAWDVFQYMQTSKLLPNARSHLLILRDSFQKRDLKRVDEVMTAIHNGEDLVRDQYLMAYSMNIIRNISTYEKKLDPSEARAHVMAIYDRGYDRGPLVKLGLAESLINGPSLPQPSPTLLAFTIWTLTLVQQRESNIRHLWEWVKYLVANGDESIIQAARYDIIYNGFILFYARSPATLFRALDVMQYMLLTKLRPPTLRTWSMLLCSFLKHGQLAQAERVLEVMRYKRYDVQRVLDRYGSYVPEGHDLQAMVESIDKNLDEKNMPEDIRTLLGESPSLRKEESVDGGDRF